MKLETAYAGRVFLCDRGGLWSATLCLEMFGNFAFGFLGPLGGSWGLWGISALPGAFPAEIGPLRGRTGPFPPGPPWACGLACG